MDNRKIYAKPKPESVHDSITKIGYFNRRMETPASIGSGIPSSQISADTTAVLKRMNGDDGGGDPFSDLTNNSTNAWVDDLVNSPERALSKNNGNSGKKKPEKPKVEPKDLFQEDDPMSQEMLSLFTNTEVPPEQEEGNVGTFI